MDQDAFPNYTQLSPRLPKLFWWLLRWAVFAITLLQIGLLIFKPETGLVLFWQLLIPLLPLSFAVMPGLWRNICPLALLNQLPRTLGFSRENTLPDNLRKLALYLSVIGFIVFVLMRRPLLNQSGMPLGLILLAALVLAFIGGYFYKGRSGWCGTFCPLAPIQKAYGHAPLLLVRNGYCEPCLGCQKNCYDFNPRAAIFSDLDDTDGWWTEQRKFFIAMLPGLIVAFFNNDFQATIGWSQYLVSMGMPIALSVGLFYSVHNLLRVNFYRLASAFSMLALAIFYWHGTPVVADGLHKLFDLSLPLGVQRVFQFAVIGIALVVIVRGLFSEYQYRQSRQNSVRATLGDGVNALKAALESTRSMVHVTEQSSGSQLLMQSGKTLLDAIEEAELPIMSGCRMGMCGSDPVVITEGMDNLDPPDDNELNTLRRLGLEGKARLACCCKPKAAISIDLAADPAQISAAQSEADQNVADEAERRQIIIIGNGIAGISTAERLREQDRDSRIILITQEPYHFYNRMGLEQVLVGRSALQDLYLMKPDWYQRNDIDFWLNTRVNRIDPESRSLTLGTAEKVAYDKLVLATGANAFAPDQPDYQLPGVFVLRSADNAIRLRAWIQQNEARRAVVLGGGVLGVEAAEALMQMGLRVAIVHGDSFLMNRQLDREAALILQDFLANKGIRSFTGNGIESIDGSGELKKVLLKDKKILVTDLLLLCIGIRAETTLARAAGLEVNRGIVVDDRMQTSDPDIFCVGDAAELPGAMGGLWAVGSDQGKVAADNILGCESRYSAQALPPVQLKVSGIDLKSFGNLLDENAVHFTSGSLAEQSWAHVLSRDGKIVSGVFVNRPQAANVFISASKKADERFSDEKIREMLEKDGK
jgi:NADPH-dependent 2,4-dienoyl-CoA reductase/sulfur reductase-like enzyme/ferredoxin